MNSAPASTPNDAAIAQRVRIRTMAHRRRRILWNVLFFVLVTAAMVYVVLAQRDDQAVQNLKELGQTVAGAMQAEWKRSGQLPAGIPELAPPMNRAASRLAINAVYAEQIRERSPVLVCVTPPIRLYLKENGRMLVVFDGTEFKAEWVNEGEFVKKANSLGVRLPDGGQ